MKLHVMNTESLSSQYREASDKIMKQSIDLIVETLENINDDGETFVVVKGKYRLGSDLAAAPTELFCTYLTNYRDISTSKTRRLARRLEELFANGGINTIRIAPNFDEGEDVRLEDPLVLLDITVCYETNQKADKLGGVSIVNSIYIQQKIKEAFREKYD